MLVVALLAACGPVFLQPVELVVSSAVELPEQTPDARLNVELTSSARSAVGLYDADPACLYTAGACRVELDTSGLGRGVVYGAVWLDPEGEGEASHEEALVDDEPVGFFSFDTRHGELVEGPVALDWPEAWFGDE